MQRAYSIKQRDTANNRTACLPGWVETHPFPFSLNREHVGCIRTIRESSCEQTCWRGLPKKPIESAAANLLLVSRIATVHVTLPRTAVMMKMHQIWNTRIPCFGMSTYWLTGTRALGRRNGRTCIVDILLSFSDIAVREKLGLRAHRTSRSRRNARTPVRKTPRHNYHRNLPRSCVAERKPSGKVQDLFRYRSAVGSGRVTPALDAQDVGRGRAGVGADAGEAVFFIHKIDLTTAFVHCLSLLSYGTTLVPKTLLTKNYTHSWAHHFFQIKGYHSIKNMSRVLQHFCNFIKFDV